MRTLTTISTVNRLIRTCRDAESLIRAWGRSADSTHLRTRYRIRSEEWARQGDELQALVLLMGGEPANSATLIARTQCAWVIARSTLLGYSDSLAVEGSEQAQYNALRQYEEALSGYLPERIRRTVGLQAARIADRCGRPAQVRVQFAAP